MGLCQLAKNWIKKHDQCFHKDSSIMIIKIVGWWYLQQKSITIKFSDNSFFTIWQ